MTSKEKLQELKEQIQKEMAYHWQGYERQKYETHKYDEDFDSIIKDLEKLEHIKILVEKYNNDELHFTRGFNFIEIVKEVLNNDR